MKKSMYLMAIAATALASCSSDEVVELNKGNEIQFSVVADNESRATTVYCNNNLMKDFKLYAGYKNAEGKFSTFIEEDNIAVSSDGKCTNEETRYWPETGSLTFYGLVNNGASASNADDAIVWGDNTPVVSGFTPAAKVEEQTDLLYAVAADKTSGPVAMHFKHALSQIEFRAKNDNPQLHVVVKAIRVGQAQKTGTFTLPNETTKITWQDVHDSDKADIPVASQPLGVWSAFNGNADYTVTLETPVAVWAGEQNATNLTLSTDDATGTGYAKSLLLLPYEGENNEASTAWTPAAGETAYDGTYLAVNCVIYNVAGDKYVEGSDVAELHNGWAVIPVSFKWKQGKQYIYTFNFTKEGNGGYEEEPGTPDPENPDQPGTPTITPVLTGIELTVTVDDFVGGGDMDYDMDTTVDSETGDQNK